MAIPHVSIRHILSTGFAATVHGLPAHCEKPVTWRTHVGWFLVWLQPFDLSSIGEPTGSYATDGSGPDPVTDGTLENCNRELEYNFLNTAVQYVAPSAGAFCSVLRLLLHSVKLLVRCHISTTFPRWDSPRYLCSMLRGPSDPA